MVPLTAPVAGPPVPGPANPLPPPLPAPELLPELEPLLLPLLDVLPELDPLLDPELELPDPAGVHPGAGPAFSSIPLPSAIYIEQSGNVTLPSTIAYVAPL